jgi:hypothetical protein
MFNGTLPGGTGNGGLRKPQERKLERYCSGCCETKSTNCFTRKKHGKGKGTSWNWLCKACESKIKHFKLRSHKMGYACDLNIAWYREKLQAGVCEITGLPFQKWGTSLHKLYAPSVDRIDNSKGYMRDNCRMILYGINALKGEGTDQDMETIARALVSFFDQTKSHVNGKGEEQCQKNELM